MKTERRAATVHMPSTMWTTILQFHRDPERVKDFVVRRYRQPVAEFVRRQGLKEEDAEDLTQEVFLRVCQENFLKKADQIRGKFRTVLLAVTKHVIDSWRRHELAGIRDRRRQVSLEGLTLPEELPTDPEFDRLWVQNLMAQAMERLKDDPGTEALKLQLEGLSYQEISDRLGRKVTDVTNFIHRAKDRLKKEFERLIAEYSTREDVAEEIAALRRFL
jgi:RNA polymerase sigma-70 factor (ECF subfamily)